MGDGMIPVYLSVGSSIHQGWHNHVGLSPDLCFDISNHFSFDFD